MLTVVTLSSSTHLDKCCVPLPQAPSFLVGRGSTLNIVGSLFSAHYMNKPCTKAESGRIGALSKSCKLERTQKLTPLLMEEETWAEALVQGHRRIVMVDLSPALLTSKPPMFPLRVDAGACQLSTGPRASPCQTPQGRPSHWPDYPTVPSRAKSCSQPAQLPWCMAELLLVGCFRNLEERAGENVHLLNTCCVPGPVSGTLQMLSYLIV